MTTVVATPETNAGDVPPEVSERVRHENWDSDWSPPPWS